MVPRNPASTAARPVLCLVRSCRHVHAVQGAALAPRHQLFGGHGGDCKRRRYRSADKKDLVRANTSTCGAVRGGSKLGVVAVKASKTPTEVLQPVNVVPVTRSLHSTSLCARRHRVPRGAHRPHHRQLVRGAMGLPANGGGVYERLAHLVPWEQQLVKHGRFLLRYWVRRASIFYSSKLKRQ